MIRTGNEYRDSIRDGRETSNAWKGPQTWQLKK
jgi:hypothetical protein